MKFLATAILTLVLTQMAHGTEEPNRILFSGCAIFDGVTDGLAEDRNVLVEDNLIDSVWPMLGITEEKTQDPRYSTVYDNFEGRDFPPTMVQVGTKEIQMSDGVRMYGVPATKPNSTPMTPCSIVSTAIGAHRRLPRRSGVSARSSRNTSAGNSAVTAAATQGHGDAPAPLAHRLPPPVHRTSAP